MLKLISIMVLLNTVNATNDDPIQKSVEDFMMKGNVPGLFILVVKGDSVVYKRGFGVTNIHTRTPVTINTLWEPGSITKAFTAEMIIDLYHRKLLDINDPISRFFKEAPPSWGKIQISHLLNHSSGIQNYLLNSRFHAAEYFSPITANNNFERFIQTVNSDSLVKMFYALPLEFEPGKTWSYSNTGYFLLGKIIESVTRMNFFEYTRQNLLIPIGMKESKAGEGVKPSYMAQGYIWTSDGLKEAWPLSGEYAFSAGAWIVSANDMIQYLKAYHTKKLPSDRAGFSWELGSNTEHPFLYSGGRFFSNNHHKHYTFHNGGTPGFSASWIYEATENISVLLMINRQDFAPLDQLAAKILGHYINIMEYKNTFVKTSESAYWETIMIDFIEAVKTNQAMPEACSEALRIFLESENGRGFWNWYFSDRFPDSITCTNLEKSSEFIHYHFIVHSKGKDDFPLIATVNQKNELVRIGWW